MLWAEVQEKARQGGTEGKGSAQLVQHYSTKIELQTEKGKADWGVSDSLTVNTLSKSV